MGPWRHSLWCGNKTLNKLYIRLIAKNVISYHFRNRKHRGIVVILILNEYIIDCMTIKSIFLNLAELKMKLP